MMAIWTWSPFSSLHSLSVSFSLSLSLSLLCALLHFSLPPSLALPPSLVLVIFVVVVVKINKYLVWNVFWLLLFILIVLIMRMYSVLNMRMYNVQLRCLSRRETISVFSPHVVCPCALARWRVHLSLSYCGLVIVILLTHLSYERGEMGPCLSWFDPSSPCVPNTSSDMSAFHGPHVV